jgi:DNA helicase II / ATP-dependent DNA helicase PcrA
MRVLALWSWHASQQTTTVGRGINLFSCVFIDEVNDSAVVARKPHPAQPLQPLGDSEAQQVKDGKLNIWKRSGCLTHSDAALLASIILNHEKFGAVVRGELVRRFPLLIVDELQDTGYFLGKSVLLLLNEPSVCGVLVGDPDQAIFEFNGARPDLFDRFQAIIGAQTFPLAQSKRCPSAIVAVAQNVKHSNDPLIAAEDKQGWAFLVRYNDMQPDLARMLNEITTIAGHRTIKVIARETATVESLTVRSAKIAPKLGSPPLNHMQRAVRLFRQVRRVAALAAARTAINLSAFDHEGVTDEALAADKIDPHDWKACSVRCLLRANSLPTTCDVWSWQKQVGMILDEEIGRAILSSVLDFTPGNLNPWKRQGWDSPCADYLPQTVAAQTVLGDVPVQTVHAVKGETHDLTVLVCPPPKSSKRCPSAVWWSDDLEDQEEKRIAYVAMTRSQSELILCVSDACYARLATSRHQFVASFECMTIDEYIVALSQRQ